MLGVIKLNVENFQENTFLPFTITHIENFLTAVTIVRCFRRRLHRLTVSAALLQAVFERYCWIKSGFLKCRWII